MDRAVVWFRRDLRTHDNPTFIDAVSNYDQVIPIYVFDPFKFDDGMFNMSRMSSFRTKFLWDSVNDLRSSIQSFGGDLAVRSGKPETVIPNFCEKVDADAVHFQTIPATQEIQTEKSVKKKLDIPYERYWSHTLYHLNDLETPYNRIDDTFTPWRKDTQYNVDVRSTVSEPDSMSIGTDIKYGEIPSPDEFNLNFSTPSERSSIYYDGGESAGIDRIQEYIWEEDNLRNYKETRNGLLGEDYSSKFSPWLSLGCVSPRYIYEEVKKYEEERVSNDSTYWLIFELMWRDFFQFQFLKHGSDFFQSDGIRSVDPFWRQDTEDFNKWAEGNTGVPFVDANMRELNETGFMSNRGRQNVASFLIDVLDIDWRMGAMYFQSKLVDYDVCSNWGNWAYIAGVGNDSRDDRYFNVVKQSKRYDENAEYIRHWIPEFSNLPADAAHEPWLMTEGQQSMYGVKLGSDYPDPIVDFESKTYEELVNERIE